MSKLEEKEIRLHYLKAKMAISQGNCEEMKRIVQECPECINITTYMAGTLLHVASFEGTPDMIEFLIQLGSNINRIEDERSPICEAVSNGLIDNVKKLIELGAELKGDICVSDPLIIAIYNDSQEIAKLLIDAGIDLTYQFKTRDNPWWDTLSYSEYYGRTEISKMIKEKLDADGIKIEDIPPKIEDKQNTDEEIVYFEDYLEKYLGKISYSYTNTELLKKFWRGKKQVINDVEISIAIIMPDKDRDYITLITSGMSMEPMAEDSNGVVKYAEIMMKLPADWKVDEELLKDDENNWPLYMLSKVAYLSHISEAGYINNKVIVPYGIPKVPNYFYGDKEFTCVMLCKSEDIPPYVIDNETVIDFFTLIPITEEEAALAKQKGNEAVKDMLPDGEIVNIERDYLC